MIQKLTKIFVKMYHLKLSAIIVSTYLILATSFAHAASYSAIVMDVKTGEILHAENQDTRLHPAGLTKLMTLYTAFSAIENGEVSLEDPVLVSQKAAFEPSVKLGLRKQQKIKLRYLLRAIGIQGANDASTALAEHIAGSEEAYAKRMQVYSDEIGLTRSSWRNQHGLTQSQHFSTARDIALLFIALERDFPDYFNLFRRRSEDAGIRQVANSSRRILNGITGAIGAKYGYTRAAGFNAATIVERGGNKIVVVIFGARSSASLVAMTGRLADVSFKKF